MKGSVAFSSLPILILVLQASFCLASRQGGARSLLQAVVLAAGDGCVSGDQCSKGDGTSALCPTDGSAKCPAISAGAVCRSRDQCKATVSSDGKTQLSTLCPADPGTKNGTCLPMPASTPCSSGDLCATSATGTTLCPISGGAKSAACPDLLSGSTCSSLTGKCAGGQECSAAPPAYPATNPNADALAAQSSTAGVCVDPKGAGQSCTVGADYCNSQIPDSAATWCPSAPCKMARPGQSCNFAAPIDRCYTAVNPNGVPCTVGDGGDSAVCAVLASGAACYAGDACTAPEQCNAVGSSIGKCVPIIPAGAACQDVATATDASPATFCRVKSDSGFQGLAAGACPSTKLCPLIPAGDTCVIAGNSQAADTCSDGGDTTVAPFGLECPGGGICTARTVNCYAGDDCSAAGATASSYALCSAVGTTVATKGQCKISKPAGAACNSGDVCTQGTLCPDSKFCPILPAGSSCTPAQTAATPPRAADQCFNGISDPTKNSTDCPAGGTICPSLDTGLACGPLDVCIKGAKCINNKCYPNSKVFSSSNPASTPSATAASGTVSSTSFSTAAEVPSVKSEAVLTNYIVGNFTSDVQKQFCNTIVANIFTSYKVVSNCTVGTVVSGSVVVPTTVAFTGADSTQATAAQSAFATALKSQDTSVFGTQYGTVTVAASSVQSVQSTNPQAETATSGAAALGMAWTVVISALLFV